jgi:hypothetical protein
MQKDQIVKSFQIRFILCWSFQKGSIIAIFTWARTHELASSQVASQYSIQVATSQQTNQPTDRSRRTRPAISLSTRSAARFSNAVLSTFVHSTQYWIDLTWLHCMCPRTCWLCCVHSPCRLPHLVSTWNCYVRPRLTYCISTYLVRK